MDVEISDDPSWPGPVVEWEFNGKRVSIPFSDSVHAQYSKPYNVVVAVSGDKKVRVFSPDGKKVDEFSFSENNGGEFYTTTESIRTDSGVAAVFGYQPEVDGETFWQHEIDLKNSCIGKNRISKWR